MHQKDTRLKEQIRHSPKSATYLGNKSSVTLLDRSFNIKRVQSSASNLSTGIRTDSGSSITPSIAGTSPNIIIGGVDLFGNTVGTAFNLGNMGSTTYTQSDFVGANDTTDFFRFTLSNSTTFNLSLSGLSADADLRLYNGSGVEIARSAASGIANEAISRFITAGTYYVEAYRFGTANTNYSLRLQGVSGGIDPGSSIATARDQGNLTRNTRAINDFVGATDTNDYIQFQLSEYSNFNLSLGNLTSDADVQLLNSSGTVIASSTQSSTISESISTRLNVGTYYIRVFPYSGSSNYQLDFSANGVSDLAGNTTSTARSITVGSTPTSYDDWVGTVDTNDYYRFTLSNASTFNLALDSLVADADVKLLNGSGTLIASSALSGTSNETMRQSLTAGTYFIQVYPYSSANTPYRLTVSATGTTPPPSGDPGNSLGTSEVQSSPVFSRNQQVSSADRNDYYRFTTAASGIFRANLAGLSGDADLQLIRDANGNGAVDRGEVLAWQWERGTGSESIRRFLAAGTYFLGVNSYNTATANYSLSTSFTSPTTDDRRFSISVNFLPSANALTTAMRNAVVDAARIWENVISFSSFNGNQNLVIDVGGQVQQWSNGGGVLASAAPRTFATDTNGRSMPTSGFSNINTNPGAISALTSNIEFFRGVMAHEFGHVLGLGTLWENSGRAFINRSTGTYSANTYAGWAYGELRNTFRQTAVPVTTGVGPGSDYSHWREATFNSELMTHAANSGGMPLSQLTIASLRDIGWNVNYGAADPYTLPPGAITTPSIGGPSLIV